MPALVDFKAMSSVSIAYFFTVSHVKFNERPCCMSLSFILTTMSLVTIGLYDMSFLNIHVTLSFLGVKGPHLLPRTALNP